MSVILLCLGSSVASFALTTESPPWIPIKPTIPDPSTTKNIQQPSSPKLFNPRFTSATINLGPFLLTHKIIFPLISPFSSLPPPILETLLRLPVALSVFDYQMRIPVIMCQVSYLAVPCTHYTTPVHAPAVPRPLRSPSLPVYPCLPPSSWSTFHMPLPSFPYDFLIAGSGVFLAYSLPAP